MFAVSLRALRRSDYFIQSSLTLADDWSLALAVSLRSALSVGAERDPKRYGPLLARMDRSGNVHGAFRQLERWREAELIAAEQPSFPLGRFRTLVADAVALRESS